MEKEKRKRRYHFIRQDNTGQWSHKKITIAKKIKRENTR